MAKTSRHRIVIFPFWVFNTALMFMMMVGLLVAMALVPESISGVRHANLYVIGAIMTAEVAAFVCFQHFMFFSRVKELSRILMEDPVITVGDLLFMEYIRSIPAMGIEEVVSLKTAIEQMFFALSNLWRDQGLLSVLKSNGSSAAAGGDKNAFMCLATCTAAFKAATAEGGSYDEYVEPNLSSFSVEDYLLSRQYHYKQRLRPTRQSPCDVVVRASPLKRGLFHNFSRCDSTVASPTIEADFCTVCSSLGDEVEAIAIEQSSSTRHLSYQSSLPEPLSISEEESMLPKDEDNMHTYCGASNRQFVPALSAEDRALCDPLDDNSNNSFEVLTRYLHLEGAIIFQVLKTIRVGRSLSSVTLPVHILESRSLLEMISDMFLAWDILMPLALGEVHHPVDRMRILLRWFFSAYNWRPKGAAKKPYNPILGEVFRCKCPAPLPVSSPASLLSFPPSRERFSQAHDTCPEMNPKRSIDCMHFLAEQVCHRPPVSAFYAELPDLIVAEGVFVPHSKLVSLNCVASLSCSSVLVRFPKTGWSFRFSLPHAYASGVVAGTPRLELGGVVRLEDCQSLAHVMVDFRRKGFFSGKHDEVVAKISTEDGKEIAEEYVGLWNGPIYSRGTGKGVDVGKKRQNHHLRPQEGDGKELLFDAEIFQQQRGMPCCRPYAYPLHAGNDDHPYPKQSRAVWKELTAAIRQGDVEAASNAKKIVEEAQRAERRQLEAEGRVYTPKFFEFIGAGKLSDGNEETLSRQENWRFTARDMLLN
ncbi:putative oxysterol-binding protein [Trypanosoma cruzi]|uniref:Oxysterol-binding protein, putative n=1 Tax=Trypanosoma cruzi (strain CL Brener) TaxID=353153 RepID=Q4DJ73_TRYCC|nr:oxysterol-binding protein, putative [Trypanosoma cruzi]EAN92588.1 oxysterol-binding protein, putative [Trypanosoma cruzi]RNC49260.1 putative oxysterol-binding protein [Trypanosoma cruzi]|eukprot:XP_814439.1 oxysterol-binding protein [Trypanosoma cruzi strain CL Brener]